MPKARIVVVEDEPAIRRGVSDALRLSGYDVTEAPDGAVGYTEGAAAGVDLVLLDLQLPRRDGLDVLADIRRTCPTRPVIILTARGTEDDRVKGLKMGADDYVVKPFSAKELLARVEAVLRRTLKPPTEVKAVKVGKGNVDLHRREIRWPCGTRHDLSETETALLKYLVSNRERAVSREELLNRVWGIGTAGLETRAVDMHVARLRAKLKDPAGDDHQPEAILQPPAFADIDHRADHGYPLIGLDRIQADFQRKFAAILAQAEQLAPGAHHPCLRPLQKVGAKQLVTAAEALGNQHLHRPAEHLVARIAKTGFGLRVDQRNQAVAVDLHHRSRRCFEQPPQALGLGLCRSKQTLLAQTTPCAQYQQQRQCQPAGISRGRQRLGSGGLASPQQQCNKQTAERFHRSIPEFASDSQV